MNGAFGRPPLRAPIDREAAEMALRKLVEVGSSLPNHDMMITTCGRDVLAYIEQLEVTARMADERVAEINRKLDNILTKLG